VRRKILGRLLIAYLEIFRRFIWLLRKAQFLGSCASIILRLRISKLFMYCKSTNYFTTGNHLHNCLLCIEKFYGKFKIAFLETYQRFVWLLRKAHFFGYCASIILLLRISQLFIYCKSTNYFTTANRQNISLLCIEKFYDNYT